MRPIRIEMRMMGLDVGDRRIGVAMCDPMEVLASALTVIERTDDSIAIETILDLIEEHKIGRIIVGLPRLMDGRIGTQSQKAIEFADKLSEETTVPIEMSDERLSTSIADKLLREAGKNHQQIKEKRDAAAAALILQWYIDQKNPTGNNDMETMIS